MTPTVRGETLFYQQDGQEHILTVDTAAWYSWLETASTFSFVSEEGLFTARREQSGHKRGGWYWKAYRKQHGKLSSRYIGKSGSVTLARLRATARALSDALEETASEIGGLVTVPPVQASVQDRRSDVLSPLLATKLNAPQPPVQLVSRPHLVERLGQAMERPLTLIAAPAGFGKTTLLSSWLKYATLPVAWLSLEQDDDELTRFCALPHKESDFAFITKHSLCVSFLHFQPNNRYANFLSPKRYEVAIMRFKRQISGEATRGLSVIWWRCLSPDVSKGGECEKNESSNEARNSAVYPTKVS